LAPFEKNAGTASALLGAFQMGIGSAVSVGVSLFSGKTAMPMAAIMVVSASLALIVLLIGRRNIKEKTEAKAGQIVAH
jgi:DHA1 family bicyclomycin/chloramphenicol resistance-like MFS transporter